MDLESCARSLLVDVVYVLAGGNYVPLIPGVPDFVNQPFRDLFADGLPAFTPLVVGSNGPQEAADGDRAGGEAN